MKKSNRVTPPPSTSLGFPLDDPKEEKPRPIDVTLVNRKLFFIDYESLEILLAISKMK